MRRFFFVWTAFVAACAEPSRPAPTMPSRVASAPVSSARPAAPVSTEPPREPTRGYAAPAAARPDRSKVQTALFGTSPSEAARACTDVRCLLALGYVADPEARTLVLDLFDRFGIVTVPGQGETMDMSYRGVITVVPALPLDALRTHLEWAHAAFDDISRGLDALNAARPIELRFPATLAFVRSTHGNRPSGYALDWVYTYNVQGSLNRSAESVRGVAFHEMFHLVDAAGASSWSDDALGADVHAILARCNGSTSCLTPYSPTKLKVRGGTFYAFQAGNDIVAEYAAELALRVLDEQRGRLGQGPVLVPFKCGPAPNAHAWQAMIDRWFGGQDLVPACP